MNVICYEQIILADIEAYGFQYAYPSYMAGMGASLRLKWFYWLEIDGNDMGSLFVMTLVEIFCNDMRRDCSNDTGRDCL